MMRWLSLFLVVTVGSPAVASSAGGFSSASLTDLEARAKKAGWKVKSSGVDNQSSVAFTDLELDDGKHWAYVAMADLTSKSGAVLVGDDQALRIEVDGDPDATMPKPAELLKKLEGLKGRDAIVAEAKKLGLKVLSSNSETVDGLTTTFLELENKRGSVALVDLLDYAAAKKEGRIAIDGKRVLNVYVCEDCVKDRANVLSKAWQIAKARTLLAKLSAK